MIMTHSMRLADGAMQARGKGIANANILIIDEAQELPSEEEFIKLNDSFRMKDTERKIILLLNPTTKLHWIHKRWFIDGKPNSKWFKDHCFMHLTYHQNQHNLDPKKVAEWERMREQDPSYYDHHILGLWQDGLQGRIFTDWNSQYSPDPEAKTIVGLDFGFSSDPTAAVEIKLYKDSIWIKELIYDTGLTNSDIYELLIKKDVPKNSIIIADSAEPKSIEELKRLGFTNIQKAYKGPDSIKAGIRKLHSLKVYVDPSSTNLWNEYHLYTWDKTGERPIDQHNHLIDAIRYALSLESTGTYAVNSNKSVKRKPTKTTYNPYSYR
jgi:phage terminase large subunit